jgi:hypothetical protein
MDEELNKGPWRKELKTTYAAGFVARETAA